MLEVLNMPVVLPEHKGRARVDYHKDKLSINIATKINIFRSLFLAFFTIHLLFIVFVLLTTLVPEIIKNGITDDIFMYLIILLFLIPIGLALIFLLMWNLFGRENIIITDDILKVKRSIFGMGFEKEYILTEVKNIRLSNSRVYFFNMRYLLESLGYGGGILAFDYGMKTINFAGSIEEAEGHKIINIIKDWENNQENR